MPSSSRAVARRQPAGAVARRGPPVPLERAAHAAHARSAQLQAGASAAGAATNRVLSATAAPLGRAPSGSRRRRVHAAGAKAAGSAASAVADATSAARSATYSTAAAVSRASGDSPESRGLVSLGVSVFEVAAAAPVFVQHMLSAGQAVANGKPPKIGPAVVQQICAVGQAFVNGKPVKIKPPKYNSPGKPSKPSKLNSPNKPGKFSHHWVNGQWVPIKPAVDAYGKPYKPPTGYPVARSLTARCGAVSAKERKTRK